MNLKVHVFELEDNLHNITIFRLLPFVSRCLFYFYHLGKIGSFLTQCISITTAPPSTLPNLSYPPALPDPLPIIGKSDFQEITKIKHSEVKQKPSHDLLRSQTNRRKRAQEKSEETHLFPHSHTP